MSDAELFLQAWVASTGCPSWAENSAGTFFCADAGRVGTGRVSACRVVGSGPTRTILRADPALAEMAQPILSTTTALSDEQFLAWSNSVGANVLGGAVMKTLPANLGVRPDDEDALSVLRLDWSNPEHMALMEGFVAALSEGDLDEAEIDLDDLDELAVCSLDESGQIDAYASTRPFDEAVEFGDIGIAVVASARRRGVGTALVGALIDEVMVPLGHHPLYRCDRDNSASNLLSDNLGFETVLELLVVEVPVTETG